MPRILFLDDEPAIVDAVILAARFAGVEVEGFTRAAEALERFGAEPRAFRAVITDFTMSDMACADFIARIRALGPGIPVHLCTGNADHEIVEASRGLAISGILYKPFDFEALAAFLKDILGPGN